ncbi:MAG: glycosyltransferase family 2 protein [Alphaproteobacteria bacterium]|nr:glycosyltransferase family 2 protein [Alphaproteobacteria bacterium]
MAGPAEQVAVVIPVYGPQAPVDRLLHEIPVALHPWTWIVDDATPTPTQLPAHAPTAHLLRHPRNRGYGGSQKTGYAAAIAAGADRIVLLHGDAQYPTAATLALADALDDASAALGSRFLEAHGRGVPGWRRVGNRFLTGVANLRFGTRVSELHTGARAFRADVLADLPLQRFSDDYLFDQQVLVSLLARGLPIAERPVSARYDDDVQSITFRRSVTYGLGCLWTIARGPPA